MPAVSTSVSAARLIAVGGLSGTGKSTLARALVDLMPNCGSGALLLRSDVERKLQFGVAETTRLGPESYRPDVTAQVYSALAERAATALAEGKIVIVDAVFARASERDTIAAVAHSRSAPFAGLWLEAPQDVQVERVKARRGDASDATADIVARQATYDLGHITWHRIDASAGPDRTLAAARALLNL